ncbi:hypothetical protein ACROYT_G009953 [Oculina patagonica]
MIRRKFSLVWAVCFVFLMFEITSHVKGDKVNLNPINQTPGGYGGVFSKNDTSASSVARRNEIPSEEARSQGGRSRQNSDRDSPQRGKSNKSPGKSNDRPDKKPGDKGAPSGGKPEKGPKDKGAPSNGNEKPVPDCNNNGHRKRQTPGGYGGAFPPIPPPDCFDNSTSIGNQGNSNSMPDKNQKGEGAHSDEKSNNRPDKEQKDKGASTKEKSKNRQDKRSKDQGAPSDVSRPDETPKEKGAPSDGGPDKGLKDKGAPSDGRPDKKPEDKGAPSDGRSDKKPEDKGAPSDENSKNQPDKKPEDKGAPSDGKSTKPPERKPEEKDAPSDRGKSNNGPDKKRKDKGASSDGNGLSSKRGIDPVIHSFMHRRGIPNRNPILRELEKRQSLKPIEAASSKRETHPIIRGLIRRSFPDPVAKRNTMGKPSGRYRLN